MPQHEITYDVTDGNLVIEYIKFHYIGEIQKVVSDPKVYALETGQIYKMADPGRLAARMDLQGLTFRDFRDTPVLISSIQEVTYESKQQSLKILVLTLFFLKHQKEFRLSLSVNKDTWDGEIIADIVSRFEQIR